MEKTTLSPAIILDRDGTLHRDTHYLIRFEDFEVLPGVEEALKILLEKGYRLFAATNQSGVARGMFPLEKVLELNTKIRGYFLEKGINIEDIAINDKYIIKNPVKKNLRTSFLTMLIFPFIQCNLILKRLFTGEKRIIQVEKYILKSSYFSWRRTRMM